MTNLIKSHTFKVTRANGIDDFLVQLRAAYWSTITSERRLTAALDRSIARYERTQPAYGASLRRDFTQHNYLKIMRDWGMMAGTERLTRREEQATPTT